MNNTKRIRIALDAMGGDRAPKSVIAGAAIAKERYPSIDYLFYGDEEQIARLIAREKNLKDCSQIIHTSDIIPGDMKAAQALRAGRNSSMRLAIDAVAKGNAESVVSCGNTGALMAMAKFTMKTLPTIDRPAIVAFFPTLKGETVMLDLGANTNCTPQNLLDFAVMGAIFATTVLGVINPKIGLLNVGSEDIKGRDDVRQAATLLRDTKLPGEFVGFVEGDDITKGAVDVVVTDGFTGNVALKTAEGTAKMYTEFLKRTFKSSWLAQIGFVMARSAFEKLKKRIDPRMYNGAMFIGLRGICVKSHGSSDAIGFANAIGVAHDLVLQNFNSVISTALHEMHLIKDQELHLTSAQTIDLTSQDVGAISLVS